MSAPLSPLIFAKNILKFNVLVFRQSLRHLALFGRQVERRLRPPRYQCQRCQGKPTTTQRATWYDPRSRCTRAFEKQVLLACVNSTVWDVRIKEGIGYETVRGIIDRAIAKNVDCP
ncbi:MAG: transposase family protein [Candidatus Competibacteraceae bacterium]|nr:transposase family protein [Candidatus Competibacteraceae bacterium]MBK8754134.1 transposase family protein [Candidatus Competibacteraceae bacterium]